MVNSKNTGTQRFGGDPWSPVPANALICLTILHVPGSHKGRAHGQKRVVQRAAAQSTIDIAKV